MPVFPRRVLMLDPARCMESKEYYRFLLPWLKEWGYNALHLHLTDDQGCALVFPSHPELASGGAFTPQEMREFIKTAAELGIEVIPEIESLGHTRYITNHPAYRDLGASKNDASHTAIDPRHPRTRKILSDLFADAAAIFDSPLIHAGLDEVNLRQLRRYRNVSDKQANAIFLRHALWVHQAVRDAGKRPAMWGDCVLRDREMAKQIRRDVLIFDWHYEAEVDPASLEFFCSGGFEVWGVPATMCWLSAVATNALNLSNLRRFAATALLYRRKRRGSLTGIVNSVWCPWRYLSGAMDWPIALAGHLFMSEQEDDRYGREFCKKFYGLPDGLARECAALMAELHEFAPTGPIWWAAHGMPNQPFTREDARQGRLTAERFARLAENLEKIQPQAKQNGQRLADVALSARLIERLGLFNAAGRKKKTLPKNSELLHQCLASWRRYRAGGNYLAAGNKRRKGYFGGYDNLLRNLKLLF